MANRFTNGRPKIFAKLLCFCRYFEDNQTFTMYNLLLYMPCAREVGDADNDEKINQQNFVWFSVTSVIAS